MSRATHPEPSEAAATAHAELCARILRRTQSLFRLVVVACDGSRRLASREADTDIRSVDAMRSVPTIGMAARVGHPLGLSAGQAISVLSDGPVAELDAGALRAAALDADLADDGPRLARIARALARRAADPGDLAFAQLVHARARTTRADIAGVNSALGFAVEIGLPSADRAAVAQLAEAIHFEAALASPWMNPHREMNPRREVNPHRDATPHHDPAARHDPHERRAPDAGLVPIATQLMHASARGGSRAEAAAASDLSTERPNERATERATERPTEGQLERRDDAPCDTAAVRRRCWHTVAGALKADHGRLDPVEHLRDALDDIVDSSSADARAIAWGASVIASAALGLRLARPHDRRVLTLIVAAELALEVALDAQVAGPARQTLLARRTRVGLCEWHTRAHLGEIDPGTIDETDLAELVRASMLFPRAAETAHIAPLLHVTRLGNFARNQNSTLDASSSGCWMS